MRKNYTTLNTGMRTYMMCAVLSVPFPMCKRY